MQEGTRPGGEDGGDEADPVGVETPGVRYVRGSGGSEPVTVTTTCWKVIALSIAVTVRSHLLESSCCAPAAMSVDGPSSSLVQVHEVLNRPVHIHEADRAAGRITCDLCGSDGLCVTLCSVCKCFYCVQENWNDPRRRCWFCAELQRTGLDMSRVS